jgi:hypothetical protein
MLWKDKVPGLRVCLLDPRKKSELVRYSLCRQRSGLRPHLQLDVVLTASAPSTVQYLSDPF